MVKTKSTQKKIEVLSDVICDSCGKSCKTYPVNDKRVVIFEYMTLSVQWGYGSGKDCERWQAHICEACVDKKLVPVIKFEKEDYMSGKKKIAGSGKTIIHSSESVIAEK